MYITQILYFLTWPLLIFVSYRLVIFYLKKLDKKLADDNDPGEASGS